MATPAPNIDRNAADSTQNATAADETPRPTPATRSGVTPRTEAASPAPPSRSVAPPPRSYVLFRSTALGETYGRLSLAYLDTSDQQQHLTPLRCERVYYASGRGLCLEARIGSFSSYHAHLFDSSFGIQATFPLSGLPSRARLSADARVAAMTVFVSGHSYASGEFSTLTSLVDVRNGQMLVEDLETFVVLRDGAPFKAADFNFWGVTFARDSNRFYATLATGGKFYLVEGDISSRRARIIHENVECPSLSPDNTRIAFKRRVGVGERFGRFGWRLHVLDLATFTETALSSESRSVDDQVEWLDDQHIIYALPDERVSAVMNTWKLRSNGSGAPQLLVPNAFSPAVVRPE
jgi:hypothetical protein